MRHLDRITASRPTPRISITAAAAPIQIDRGRRTLRGTLLRYGETGHTNIGPLQVAPGALDFGDDFDSVTLTREHDRDAIRGRLALVDENEERIYVATRVDDGPEGDAALEEAGRRIRAGFSFDVDRTTAVIQNGVLLYGRVVAIGQVTDPAFNSARIDQIAASNHHQERVMLTAAQRARLNELLQIETRSDADQAELDGLLALVQTPVEPAVEPTEPVATEPATTAPAVPAPAAAPAAVAASRAVPAGVPAPRGPVTTRPAGGALRDFYRTFTEALRGGPAAITAALSDITWSANDVTEAPAWSGELFSGVAYQPLFTDLFNSGGLTNFAGVGWRFTKKLAIADYAGDKAAIPSDTVTTEASNYEAARMAVGVDIDRKFFDFPNEGFVQSLFEQVRESWTIKLDGKVAAYVTANAVAAEGVAAQTDLLKAAALAVRSLKRRRVGQASWILVNDDDLMSLFDTKANEVLAYLELWGIDPKNFRSSTDIVAGQVYAGVKAAATVRTLPGSPVRVEAQNLANGGVDEAFFGYWAIEEHHTSGIAKVAFAEPA